LFVEAWDYYDDCFVGVFGVLGYVDGGFDCGVG